MRVIGIIGRKGGVGKTTVAVHLAAEYTARRRRVMVVDADMQGSATYWADPGALPVPVVPLPLEDASDVPTWSRDIAAMDADVVVIDAPPHLDATLGGIIGLADVVAVPCGPSGLDLVATVDVIGLVHEIRSNRDGNKPRLVIVPNRVDRRTTSGRELPEALADLKEAIAPPLGDRTAFVDAFNAGEWVGAYAPGSVAHQEIQAVAEFIWRWTR